MNMNDKLAKLKKVFDPHEDNSYDPIVEAVKLYHADDSINEVHKVNWNNVEYRHEYHIHLHDGTLSDWRKAVNKTDEHGNIINWKKLDKEWKEFNKY